MMVTIVAEQVCCHFYGIVQCYELILCIAITLHSYFFHLGTSSQIALATRDVNDISEISIYCVRYIIVVTKKPPTRQMMCYSLYCVNESIERRRIN